MISSNAKKLRSSVDEGFLQLELVDIQSSSALKEDFQEGGTVKFWSERIQHEQFPNARKVALFILTMFDSSFTCESSFSHMNAIKTNNLHSLLSNPCIDVNCSMMESTIANGGISAGNLLIKYRRLLLKHKDQ